jgi:hypothetical protein
VKDIEKLVRDFDRIRLALLLSPAEVRTELATAKGSPKLDRHALLVELRDAELRRLQSRFLPDGIRVTVLSNDDGLPFFVVSLQSAGLQYRLVVPVVGARERAWVRECVEQRSVPIVVNASETNQLALFAVRFDPGDTGDELIRRCKASGAPSADTMLQQYTRAVATLLEPETIRSAVPLVAVNDVVVYLTVPQSQDIEGHSRQPAPSSLH